MITDGEFDSFYWNFRERNETTWGSDGAFASTYFNYARWANWGCPPGYADPAVYTSSAPPDWTSLDLSFKLSGIPEPTALLLLALSSLMLRARSGFSTGHSCRSLRRQAAPPRTGQSPG